MNTPLIIILLVFVGLVGLYLYKHSRHVGLATDSERLHATLKTIYREAGKPALSQNRLLKELKARFHVNEKVALVLISKLRREGFIKGTPDAYELANSEA